MARIEAIEPVLDPNAVRVGPVTEPTPQPDGRLQTAAYHAGVRVLRAAFVADNAPLAPGAADADLMPADGGSWGAPGAPALDPGLAFSAVPGPGDPVAPPSVAAARARPDFLAPLGWFAAIAKEINRVEGFDAWEVAPAREIRADREKYGAERVSIG